MRLKLWILGLFLCLAAVLAGCSGCSVAATYVEADRATYNVIAPKFLKYLEADETLDPKVKEADALLVKSWDLRIRKAEGK
jgi:hypothetical protein